MCFPGRRQKNLLADDVEQKKSPASTSKPAKNGTAAVAASTTPAKMAPKIAIVIYTMYGHIAKGTSDSSIIVPRCKSKCLFISVAESVKAGIAEAGGSATIFQ